MKSRPLAADEMRWRQWIINHMTARERIAFRKAGSPADPRRFVSDKMVDDARRFAERGYFNDSGKPTKPEDPTWIESAIEFVLRCVRRVLAR